MDLSSFSDENLIRALNWTLIHSLWQGILLSLIAGAIILSTKQAKPSLRYNLLATVLISYIVGVVATFLYQLDFSMPVFKPNQGTFNINVGESYAGLIMDTEQTSIIIQATNFINMNSTWFVMMWLLVILYKFIKLSFGIHNIYLLKNKALIPANEYWIQRMQELCRQLKINRKIILLQSDKVIIPVVIGFFKPVILFPAAMLAALPVNEVEAILIHEMGHIRRNDFMANLLQNILEIVFFFNPAVIWVSSLLKTEREKCCDDIAVDFIGNRQNYIQAIINFLQFEQRQVQTLAPAFTGEENHLLNRVKRIIHNRNNSLNNMEKKFLIISLLLLSFSLFAFVSLKAQVKKKKENQNIHQSASDISVEKMNQDVISATQDTIPVNKREVQQAKDKQANPHADTMIIDAEQHNPKDENVYKFANRTGIHFGDDYFTAIYNGKEISKIDGKRSKEEIEDWLKKYAPLTGVDLNAVDKSYYVKPASPIQRTQRPASIQRNQKVAVPTAPTAPTSTTAPTSPTSPTSPPSPTLPPSPIKPINSSVENTNSGTEGRAFGFTGIDINEHLAIAYINDKEISRITSKNSKAEIEKWRDDIEKLLNTKFPSIQQNLIDRKKE